MAGDLNALALSHKFLAQHVKEGAFCIDATAGRGRDTAFLCSLVGSSGKVMAFDIQQDALDSTEGLLKEKGYLERVTLLLDSHENLSRYAEPETVDAITFNFGWLPGGDHSIFTRPKSSIQAVQSGLELLKPGGVMSLCIYYGRDCGFEERDALLDFFPQIDSKQYTVLVTSFCNRPNNPPIPVFIIKDM